MPAEYNTVRFRLRPKIFNALNHYVKSQIPGREQILEEMITEYLEKRGYPTEINEVVNLRVNRTENDD